MRRHLLIYILCLATLSGCNKNTDNGWDTVEYSDFKTKVNLKGEITPIEIENKAKTIYSFDSLLFLIGQGNHFISVYSAENYKLINRFGLFGRGPNELLSLNSIQKCGDSVWLFDKMLGQLMPFHINEVLSTPSPGDRGTVTLNKMAENMLVTQNDNIITDCFEESDTRFSVYDKKGNLVGKHGDYPFQNENKAKSSMIVIESNISEMKLLPDGKILASYKRADVIELYDKNYNLLKRIEGPDHFNPLISEITIDKTVRIKNSNDSKDAYFSPVVLSDEIWLLYSGKPFYPEQSFLMNKVLVYDHNLKPLRIIELDTPIYNMCVDSANRYLYGITHIPDFSIIRFKY